MRLARQARLTAMHRYAAGIEELIYVQEEERGVGRCEIAQQPGLEQGIERGGGADEPTTLYTTEAAEQSGRRA